jgi:hypothetical protein
VEAVEPMPGTRGKWLKVKLAPFDQGQVVFEAQEHNFLESIIRASRVVHIWRLSVEVKEWLAIRKQEGIKIDADTAEVDWVYAQTLDPYGVIPDLPEDCRQVGREYFARNPGSDIWVSFDDLPDETCNALWARHKSKLAFPAGLKKLCQELDEEE